MNQELINMRKRYYDSTFNLFNILDGMKNREVVFMNRIENFKCIRGLKITNIDFFKDMLEMYNTKKKDDNIYISVCNYETIPFFELDLNSRSRYTRKWFSGDALYSMYNYDIFLDFDSKQLGYLRMTKQIKKTVDVLNKFNITFYVIFSGSNYQIVIKTYNLFNNFSTLDKQKDNFKILKLTKSLKERLTLTCLDLTGIGVPNKVMKCPYTIVYDKVCLPLGKGQIENLEFLHPDFFYINNVTKKIKLNRRGIKLNNFLNEENSDKNFENMCKELIL